MPLPSAGCGQGARACRAESEGSQLWRHGFDPRVTFTGWNIFALALLASLCGCAQPQAPPASTPSPGPPALLEPLVSTLAGNGRMRADDGEEKGAAFLFPYGLAVAPDGTIYVSDAGAQAIRRIAGGKVAFVAGDAPLGVTSQVRTGGYRDGAAMAASFNWPTGLALAHDGGLYIADTGNHCIRLLRDGVVSTFAGSPLPGKRDGERRLARFNAPQGLAFDDDGNLYVADFGNGIRRIAPDGRVTTLALPSRAGRVLAISARGAGSSLAIAYTEYGAVHLWTPSLAQTLAATDRVEPFEDVRYAAGSFYGVAILGPRAVAVTDVLHDVVRFVRFPAVPFDNYPTSRVIAGTEREGDGAAGGYADGVAPASRVDVALEIARLGDDKLVFTDAGNRRIRTIANVDPRGPVGPDLAGLYGPKSAYRVAVVGDSFAFSNVLWQESISGRIEAALAAHAGAGRAPFVSAVRLDSASITNLASFIREHLGNGQADAVVMLVDSFAHARELERPEMRNDRWRRLTPEHLRALERDLAKAGTRLLVVLIPGARTVSLNEIPDLGAYVDGTVTALSFEQDNSRAHDVEKFYESTGVRLLSLLGPMERFEESPDRYPLYNSRDEHLSPQGATFVGDAAGAEISGWSK